MTGFAATVLTLYPEMFPGMLGFSLSGKALASGLWSLDVVSLRDFATAPHYGVDDTPAGGGPGMVMRADVLARALDQVSCSQASFPRILMSPRGTPLTQDRINQLALSPGVILLCGRFEGVDERVIETRALEEISVGDYILSGGEPAATVLLDAVIRLLPGVVGNKESIEKESFQNGMLEHPHYTRPRFFEGLGIPEVLLSGDHKKISLWQEERARELTALRRPDLLHLTSPSGEEKE